MYDARLRGEYKQLQRVAHAQKRKKTVPELSSFKYKQNHAQQQRAWDQTNHENAKEKRHVADIIRATATNR